MKYLQETTDWSDVTEVNIPNHIYMVEGTKALGYIKARDGEKIMFKKPLPFSTRNRTFKQLKDL
tara:strand:- start:569 stop:760 length:192 start_codon:yes stop_codon:yes gene_type:complete